MAIVVLVSAAVPVIAVGRHLRIVSITKQGQLFVTIIGSYRTKRASKTDDKDYYSILGLYWDNGKENRNYCNIIGYIVCVWVVSSLAGPHPEYVKKPRSEQQACFKAKPIFPNNGNVNRRDEMEPFGPFKDVIHNIHVYVYQLRM